MAHDVLCLAAERDRGPAPIVQLAGL